MNSSPSTLPALLADSIGRYPGRPALVLGDAELTYEQLGDRVAAVADWLTTEAEIGPGDRVVLLIENCFAFPVWYHGVLAVGGTVVPLNPMLRDGEIRYHVNDCAASLIVTTDVASREAIAAARADLIDLIQVATDGTAPSSSSSRPRSAFAGTVPDEIAVLLYTSGTTGRAKAARLSHANLVGNAGVFARHFGFTPDDVVLGALPLFHTFGQTCGMNASITAGATLALISRFEPQNVFETIEREFVTVFEGVPTMYSMLLHAPGAGDADLGSLRLCASGGASLPIDVLQTFEEKFGCVVLEGYGLSETSPVASFNRPEARKPGSIGKPVEGVMMRIVDDGGRVCGTDEIGEIQIKGPNVMDGYWQRPEASAEVIDEDGWFSSGDLGRIDADGFHFLVDRKKDLIIRGGYNVYPREIEEVLYTHPDIVEAAVVGLPDSRLGEEVGAAIVLREGARRSTDDIKDFVRERVAPYKYPRTVWRMDALPKGGSGKILKRAIVPPASL
ncbi:long-chain-fatty-acid--CoA ligase [Nocardia nova]|uniref:long-chain-fatty-acid--CoA ligase n=1 Tax=Nocardia nova TaxID=37330 RepID=UPI00340DCB6D